MFYKIFFVYKKLIKYLSVTPFSHFLKNLNLLEINQTLTQILKLQVINNCLLLFAFASAFLLFEPDIFGTFYHFFLDKTLGGKLLIQLFIHQLKRLFPLGRPGVILDRGIVGIAGSCFLFLQIGDPSRIFF